MTSFGGVRDRFGRAAADPRRALTQRMQAHAVRLRRRRREELLTARRLGAASTAKGAAPAPASGPEDAHGTVAALVAAHPIDQAPLVRLQRLVLEDTGRSFLVQLIEGDPALCRNVAAQLTASLQELQLQTAALTILQELACLQPSTPPPADGYYGRVPPSWPELLAEDDQLLSLLLASPTGTEEAREAGLTTLGLLVQHERTARRALAACLHHWPALLQALPHSSFCCAAVLRRDDATRGMQFLVGPPPYDTTAPLVGLFQRAAAAGQDNDSMAVHAAWILQGMSFREDAVVECLCRDPALVEVVVRELARAQALGRADVLVPLLQAVGNLVTACRGAFVGLFLTTGDFIETLVRLLHEGRVLDVVPLAGGLLLDCGIPGHPSSTRAGPVLVPALVRTLLHPSYEWRAQAVVALAAAFDRPPLPPPGQLPDNTPPSSFDMQVVQDLVQRTMWGPNDSTAPSMRAPLMESLAGLVRPQDVSATFGALSVLGTMFRCVPESREVFESLQGVRRLDELCNQATGDAYRTSHLEEAQSIAADLLDQYFAVSDDDDAEDEDEAAAPATANGKFQFGLQPAFDGPLAPQGRGRGRTMPAWMQQQG